MNHEHFMRRCLALATVARDQGNTPVGSVVALDGAIIGEGIETLPTGSSLTGHAETLACQAAFRIILRQRQSQRIWPATAGCGLVLQLVGASLDKGGNGVISVLCHNNNYDYYISIDVGNWFPRGRRVAFLRQ